MNKGFDVNFLNIKLRLRRHIKEYLVISNKETNFLCNLWYIPNDNYGEEFMLDLMETLNNPYLIWIKLVSIFRPLYVVSFDQKK
jgi:hypothetical protein